MYSITKICKIVDCGKRHEAHGLCPMHYRRLQKYGDPLKTKVKWFASVEQKLINQTAFPADVNECWLWMGSRTSLGYGKFYWEGKHTSAHRAMYKTFINPDIDGLDVDHLCRNPSCTNLLHLEAVTSKENTLRGISPPAVNVMKTHCKRGHEFTPENTYITKGGNRSCIICKRASWMRGYYERKQLLKPANLN